MKNILFARTKQALSSTISKQFSDCVVDLERLRAASPIAHGVLKLLISMHTQLLTVSPSRKWLAAKMGCCEKSIDRATILLREINAILWYTRSNGRERDTNAYYLNPRLADVDVKLSIGKMIPGLFVLSSMLSIALLVAPIGIMSNALDKSYIYNSSSSSYSYSSPSYPNSSDSVRPPEDPPRDNPDSLTEPEAKTGVFVVDDVAYIAPGRTLRDHIISLLRGTSG